MKITQFFYSFILAMAVFTFSTELQANESEVLSDEEKQMLLQILDDTCGDTWCEGPLSWSFKSGKVDCVSTTCKIWFQARHLDYLPGTSDHQAIVLRTIDVACKLRNVTSFDNLMGSEVEEEETNRRIGNCIDDLEQYLKKWKGWLNEKESQSPDKNK